MAQDVLIKADGRGLYDIQVENNDFASAQGFETAIPVSLFTDARASSVQVPQAQNRRGWVGNILYATLDRQLGGLLWTLSQARLTQNTINLAKSYAEGSLQWLLEDGLARSIQISVIKASIREIKILIDIFTIDNTVQRYIILWRSTDFNRIAA